MTCTVLEWSYCVPLYFCRICASLELSPDRLPKSLFRILNGLVCDVLLSLLIRNQSILFWACRSLLHFPPLGVMAGIFNISTAVAAKYQVLQAIESYADCPHSFRSYCKYQGIGWDYLVVLLACLSSGSPCCACFMLELCSTVNCSFPQI